MTGMPRSFPTACTNGPSGSTWPRSRRSWPIAWRSSTACLPMRHGIRGGRGQGHERSLRIWSNAPHVTTLDKLGEGGRALANATVWLRSKVRLAPL